MTFYLNSFEMNRLWILTVSRQKYNSNIVLYIHLDIVFVVFVQPCLYVLCSFIKHINESILIYVQTHAHTSVTFYSVAKNNI